MLHPCGVRNDVWDCFGEERLAMTRGLIMKKGYVYMMTNKYNTVIYTGVTNDVKRRAWEHREGKFDGFTKRYNIKKLVWFQKYESIKTAILMEKKIKAGSRKKKIDFINELNPEWKDLYPELG